MPLQDYGVLKGRIIGLHGANVSDKTPHYEVHIRANQTDYRIAVNTASKEWPSELLYLVSEDFHSEHLSILPSLDEGFTAIPGDRGGIALDYIRGKMFDPAAMAPLPAAAAGPDNDLNEKVDRHMQSAKHKSAVVYAFGERFADPHRRDTLFGFTPERGIHDIHMNQGNLRKFWQDDGIWQDGGILLHFEAEQRWVGMFLAFQSQSWCTDNQGHAEKPVSACSHTLVQNS